MPRSNLEKLLEEPKLVAFALLKMIAFFADWSILYVTVIIFGIIMAIGGIVWAICFCMGRYVSHATQSPTNEIFI